MGYFACLTLLCLLLITSQSVFASKHLSEQHPLLPPIDDWTGGSLSLIQNSANSWQTYAEASDLTDSPNYHQTFEYVDRLVKSDRRLQKVSLGKSPQGRDIWMIIATKEGVKDAQSLKRLNKPTLLVQAGIHSGEIDGKDAGLMLLRDIIHGQKSKLIEQVNLLFVPILSVDAHERRSSSNRVNQRGPTNMGWRTNARNLNLNRDYTKLESVELQHMIVALNLWQPDLYFDVHVTDGEDYQYDITYGFNLDYGDSPNISKWLSQRFKPSIDAALKANGHLGGPLIFGVDLLAFDKGIVGWSPSPRFSNGYGDVRQLPTVLLENHSLKTYKQRVLGTYIFLEATLKLLAKEGQDLIKVTKTDRSRRPNEMVVAWQTNQKSPTQMDFAGIEYTKKNDRLTGLDFIEWNGQSKTYLKLPIYVMNKAKQQVTVAKNYWIPPQYHKVIAKLKLHGVEFEILNRSLDIEATQFTANNYKINGQPFEGRQMVTADFEKHSSKQHIQKGTVRVSTDQDLGRLAVALLDPRAPDSLFSWGYFNSIFQRTEYIESYALIPLSKQLFNSKPELKTLFEKKKKSDQAFASDQKLQMQWIYSRSHFYDDRYLKYPILMSY